MGSLSEEIVELIASGVDVYVATRDAELEPESMMAMGVRAHVETNTLTVYLPVALADATLRNLEANAQVAVTLVRPSDFKGIQLKGTAGGVRPSSETDKEFQRICRSALVEQLEVVGVPRGASRRLVWWPSLALEVNVRDMFVQTPGPRAGERMGS